MYGIENLQGAALGNCISGVLENMPQLQRLELGHLSLEVVRLFQPALRTNHHLKILDLSGCAIGFERLHLICRCFCRKHDHASFASFRL
jgi:hypothetical protein